MHITLGYLPPRSAEFVVKLLTELIEPGFDGYSEEGARWYQATAVVNPYAYLASRARDRILFLSILHSITLSEGPTPS
eukprot:3693627-Lingulodinium_polyedra.AAC.1